MKLSLVISVILTGLLLSACKNPSAQTNSGGSAGDKRLEIHGTVKGVDKAGKKISLAHDDVKESDGKSTYMPGMTMDFPLHDDWAFDVLEANDVLTGQLVIAKDGFWIEGIAISKGNGPGPQPEADRPGAPPPGTLMPNAQLVNQDGKTVQLDSYRGKVLVLTFLYTRCPLPEYCSLMASNFVAIDKALQKNPDQFNRTHLLSISIDPLGDKPAVLRTYGSPLVRRDDKVQFDHWEFLTGSVDEIKKAATFFGLDYFPENGQITHSLRTAIITPDGKVYKIYRGNEWRVDQLQADLNTLLNGAGQ
jgi:protein SCO1/2